MGEEANEVQKSSITLVNCFFIPLSPRKGVLKMSDGGDFLLSYFKVTLDFCSKILNSTKTRRRM